MPKRPIIIIITLSIISLVIGFFYGKVERLQERVSKVSNENKRMNSAESLAVNQKKKITTQPKVKKEAPPSNTPEWMMFSRINPSHYLDDSRFVWRFELEEQGIGGISLAKDGTIYIGSGNKLFAVNPDGSKKWEFDASGLIACPPSVSKDGNIYFTAEGKGAFAVSPVGKLIWNYLPSEPKVMTNLGRYSTPAIGSDGTVYLGGLSRRVYNINKDGSLEGWKHNSTFRAGAYPAEGDFAINAEGNIFFGNHNRDFGLFDKYGSNIWLLKPPATGVSSSPAIGPKGRIYIMFMKSARNLSFAAINSGGEIEWSLDGSKYGWNLRDSASIDSDGTIYVGDWAINKNGQLKWKIQHAVHPESKKNMEFFSPAPPVIGSDGTLYLYRMEGTYPSGITAVDKTNGKIKWRFGSFSQASNGGGSYAYNNLAPALSPDGMLYFSGKTLRDRRIKNPPRNFLFAIKTESKGLAKSSWPTRGGSNQRTGRVQLISE